VVRKIILAVALMTLAGVASANGTGSCPANTSFVDFFGIKWCVPNHAPTSARAPEIDPASAMAGLTMLAGGLAVLRGRRKVSKEKE
jgi:hypothetical protein